MIVSTFILYSFSPFPNQEGGDSS